MPLYTFTGCLEMDVTNVPLEKALDLHDPKNGRFFIYSW